MGHQLAALARQAWLSRRLDDLENVCQAILDLPLDPKTQKIVAPPGCVEAYQTYLELAPDGPHAADVKGILQGIGAEVKSTYKAPKK